MSNLSDEGLRSNNYNACRKHQDVEVFGSYGQRGCENCVFTAQLFHTHQQLMLKELLGKARRFTVPDWQTMDDSGSVEAVQVEVINQVMGEK